MLKIKFLPIVLGAVIAACGLASRPAEAIPWVASSGTGDNALSGQADFTISAGQIVVKVTNLLDPTTIRSVGQSVSDVIFTISNSPGTNGTNTAAGSLVNISGSDGSVTSVSGTPNHWINPSPGSFNISGNTITLEAIGNNGGGHDNNDQLVFPTDSGGKYANVNNGIDSHNPYVDGPATFTLPLSGVTTSTMITSVNISFGTGPDTTLTAHPVPAPLIGHGLLVLAAVGGVLFGGKLFESLKKHHNLGAV